MSTQEFSLLPAAVRVPPSTSVHRFSIDQYHKMIDDGTLSRGDRVQLLEGVIYDMTPIGIAHSYAVQGMMRALVRILPDGWDVFVQQPVTIGASEPEPDLAIVRGSYADYGDRRATAKDIGLLIEVADTSLDVDRHVKSAIYAAARVPEYWIVNLNDRQIEILTDPAEGDDGAAKYRSRDIVASDRKAAVKLGGNEIGQINLRRIFC